MLSSPFTPLFSPIGRYSVAARRQGGGDAYPTFVNPKIGTIGDSLIAHGIEGANPGTVNCWQTNAGELNLALMMHQRFRHDNWPADTGAFSPSSDRYTTGANQAISGSNAASHRAMMVNYLLPMHPDMMFYRPSVNNSVGTGTGPATFAYFQETLQMAMDAGVFCVIGTMPPWVNDPANAFNGADNNINRAYINAAIRAWVPTLPKSKAILVDYDIALDPTNTGWTDRSNMSDYIHLGTQGALKCARLINQILDLLIPARNYALELWNTGLNKYPYPTLLGNGGVTANGTGSTPTGMRTQKGGTGSSTLALSSEDNPDTGGKTRIFDITAVGTGATAYYQLGIGTTGDFTVVGQTGQWVRSIAEIEVMGNDALLVPQLWANGRRALYEGGWSGLIGDAQQQTYWLMTDAVQVSSDTANLSIRLYPNADRALGVGGTALMRAKVKRLGYFFVDNPRLAYA
ncbi:MULTISPECIES: SGNH/GDSL hydrolase family protein [Rhizobium]|uniref:SGNH/GDSL hydrolase family protein n=1 Tax=Rhizobium TaxID=379 RepID=UPI001A920214|nr:MULTISPECIES: SGNH/GDSL hydrolase family protein [Rhizobium]MBX5063458.1 SGNH/GDSL hydrolase family protein [Rhizobium lentis]MBX5075564.1 SGNH/GDSL hydrolase family protein [Rhizobium lentis]MBX5213042.1 SGNH/GDSL hydrolase family protein [Rhizobium sp. NLR9a]MBX5256002.1 SGNH/GDSL hydrolase family protein [Rhizobium sp. NLR16b]MBX5262097.1 SGNH/GDSL hydrolase family protein [Rhizobium sp. NLR16a]